MTLCGLWSQGSPFHRDSKWAAPAISLGEVIPSHWGLVFGTSCEGCRPARNPHSVLTEPWGLALPVREELLTECETEWSSQVPAPLLVRHRASVLAAEGSQIYFLSQFLSFHQPS